uniref:Uncharacterized protein n=1 Tax=Anguilla anguilla TaxID=7936 RepID=A0A0E9PZQ5_ANGAN
MNTGANQQRGMPIAVRWICELCIKTNLFLG